MKRFGGLEFLAKSDLPSINLVNEPFIDQLRNLLNQTDSSINISKIVDLFKIYPPQASVTISLYFSFSSLHFSHSRSGMTTKVIHPALPS
jgi:hypothetical protein